MDSSSRPSAAMILASSMSVRICTHAFLCSSMVSNWVTVGCTGPVGTAASSLGGDCAGLSVLLPWFLERFGDWAVLECGSVSKDMLDSSHESKDADISAERSSPPATVLWSSSISASSRVGIGAMLFLFRFFLERPP